MIKVNNVPGKLSNMKKVVILIAADSFYNEMVIKGDRDSLLEDILSNGLDFERLVEEMPMELRKKIFGIENYCAIVGIEDPFKNYGYITGELLKVV